jgi:hypothetical protein
MTGFHSTSWMNCTPSCIYNIFFLFFTLQKEFNKEQLGYNMVIGKGRICIKRYMSKKKFISW